MAFQSGMLMQLSIMLLVVLVLAATNAVATPRASAREGGAEDKKTIALPGCKDKCGNLRIPYPFGIGDGCYFRPEFNITCNESKNETTYPQLMKTRIIVTNISPEDSELEILQLVNRDCYDAQGKPEINEDQIRAGLRVYPPYTISGDKNRMFVVGCDTYARLVGSRGDQSYTTGCISECDTNPGDDAYSVDKNDTCSGMGCCRTKIPPLLNNLTLSVGSYNNHRDVYGFNPCGYAFVVKKDKFTFSKTSFQQLRHTTSLPVVLDWQIREESCGKALQNNDTFACKGNTTCHDRPTGYICLCKEGFQGNPYLPDGCQDIDECASNPNPCKNGNCQNELGSYTCSCNSGPKILPRKQPPPAEQPGPAEQPQYRQDARKSLSIPLGTSLSFFFVLLVGFFWKYHDTKKKSFIKLKNKYFEANGGKQFEEKLAIAAHGSLLKKKMTFTEEEVKEATKNFHESEKVGEGGYGIVYKGILDKQKVAIKKLKRSPPNEPFVQEMIVLSQINHKNVVRLVGCCFETPTPILVYEFIDHGTLYDRIHEKKPPLSLKLRLKIAADALAYLHHSTSNSTPIIHGDVKTANILLDENFTAKVSDFGASRLAPEDENQISTLIQGTLGYLDPEYLQSNKRTEKSDVYSFGVVLVELLTSRKAVYSGKDNEKINLADVFISMMEKDGLNEILDSQIVEGHLKRVVDLAADLAKRCVSVRGKERPSMNDVAVELQGLVRTMEKHPSGGGEADTGNLVGSSASSASLVEDPEGQAPSNKIGELSTKNKWESKLLSASFLNKMIVISCVIAISLDPLFFYIPIIDEDNKCLGMDKELRNVALILRSLTDTTFLVHIGYQIWEALNKAYKGINKGKPEWQLDWQWTLIRRDEIIPFAVIFAGKLSWGSLLIDLLSVFPMPQLILVRKVFYKMKGKGYLERRKVVNFFLISQYLPRICRIILSSKKLTSTTGMRIKAMFNLFLYILASHVLGAFWYFFSIQRETSCWYQACQKDPTHDGCKTTFYCDDRKTSTEVIAFFNKSCSIDVEDGNSGPFQYGIFLDSLKTSNTGHINFPTKLAYSFWWGLRNLSNFGTNLITSSYVWENLFAVLISITGLLLFLYLIGNVQIFIQIKSEEIRQDELRRLGEIRQKIKLKRQVIKAWMAAKGIPDDVKKEIMKNINQKLEEDKDADLENLFNVLPWYTKKFLKRFLCLNILSQVQLLKEMDDNVLKMMCNYLTPVTYPEDKIIFQRGHLIDRMLLIIEGTLSTYSTTPDPSLTHGGETDSGSTATKQVEKGEVYGEELLKWALASPSESGRFENLPTCLENVRCHTKVEGFALSAEDLRSVYREMKNKNFIKLKRKYFEDSIHLSGGKRTFTEEEVEAATKNFHESEKVGEGGYGIVYKGILDKQKVAIKKLKRSPPNEPFVQEMIVLSQINHKNVVRLVGGCFETRTPILVYEFIEHGTLYDHIHRKQPPLSLKLRLKIAAEAADALAYLHHSTSNSTPIIHEDVKTVNILLDENFTAKVSDFGASRLAPEDENQISTLVQRRRGYLDPEYLQSYKLTEKSDVYSFGVVLVELLTSRKAVYSGKDNEKINLADVFISMMEKDGLNEILDRQIVEGHLKRVADLAADLAKRCLSVRGKERPSMKEVAVELQGLVRTMERHPSGGEATIFPSPSDTGNLAGSSASSASLVDIRGDGDGGGGGSNDADSSIVEITPHGDGR